MNHLRPPDISVGLLGPREAVRQMWQVGRPMANDSVRFVSQIYDDAAQSAERWDDLAGRVQAVVFAGPRHHDLVTAVRTPTIPTTHLPLTSEALYVALLRATQQGRDVERVSVDSLADAALREAFADAGIPDDRVQVMPYTAGNTLQDYYEFHVRQAEAGAALAITTFSEVQQQLRRADLPCQRMQPTRPVIRQALRTAILLGRGRRLHDHQIAIIAVRLPAAGDGQPTGPSNYSQQDISLSVHSFLLEAARHTGALVNQRGDDLFLITVTYGGLDQLTGRLRTAPFVRHCRETLGLDLWVGVGLGLSAQAAERHALLGVEQAAAGAPGTAILIDPDGRRSQLDSSRSHRPATTGEDRAHQLLRQLVSGRRARSAELNPDQLNPDDLTVGVDEVAQILQVTPRSARRTCKTLVEAGLAWPTPPVRSPQGGRPRQQFQLLPGKLGDFGRTDGPPDDEHADMPNGRFHTI